MGSGGDRSEGDMREGVRTECDGGDRTEELFCSSDRGGEEESEGICIYIHCIYIDLIVMVDSPKTGQL